VSVSAFGAEVDVMNMPCPTRIGSLVVVAALTGAGSPAAAQAPATLNIILQVPDDGRVPRHIVAQAKPEVTRIYRDAGIDLVWNDAASGHAFALVILPLELPGSIVAPGALGGAAGTAQQRGRRAYVFYNRVERVARTYLNAPRRRGNSDTNHAIVLAHAMAHEVGHLLLPYGHSAAGLMRAEWDGQDLRLAVRGRLTFTAEQAATIRTTLLTPPASSQ
jgi:hypothetical protein